MAKSVLKKCRVCRTPFSPMSSTAKVCSWPCALDLSRQEAAKKVLARDKLARKTLKDGRDRLKSRSDWIKCAQVAFNRFIRARDAGKPCISCGSLDRASWDAGHYRSTAAAPELRFDEFNVHRQCVQCNQHQHGNIVEFRIGLVKRIGTARLEWLEGKHPPAKLTIDDIKAIIRLYRDRLKA